MEEEEEVFSDAIESHLNMSQSEQHSSNNPGTKRTHTTNLTPPSNKMDPNAILLERAISDLSAFSEQNKNSTDPVTRIVASLAAVIQVQQVTVNRLCNKLDELLSKPGTNESGGYGKPPSYIKDFFDEEKRAHSIVVQNLPESEKQSATERARDDQKAVEQILDVCNIQTIPTAVFRMGQTKAGSNARARPRLVKVELPSRALARAFLSNRGKLRSNSSLKTVFIRPSLTFEERQLHAELTKKKFELNGKLANDERDKNPYVVYGPTGSWQLIRRSEIRAKNV